MTRRQFRLAQVLAHRRRIRDEKQMALSGAVQRLTESRQALEALVSRSSSYVDTAQRYRTGAVAISALASGERYQSHLLHTIEAQGADVEQATEFVTGCRAELRAALQEVQAIERLKEKRELEQEEEERIAESRVLDDLVMTRAVRVQTDGEEERA